MRAITPAISGVATEVPPTSSAPPVLLPRPLAASLPVWLIVVQDAPSFVTQISVALSKLPLPAKKLTSGIARAVKPLVPVTPDCQDGTGQPSATRVRLP